MERDDIIYSILLVISVLLGHQVKCCQHASQRKRLVFIVGVVIIAVVCRWDCLHALLTVLVNTLIISYVSYKWCHILSFFWCFGYIAFFRTTHYFGLPQVLPHANAVQLFLTLRLVGLAFEIHDSKRSKHEENQNDLHLSTSLVLRNKYQQINPSFWDILSYSFCYIGLLTGPYYKYRVFHDMIYNKRPVDTYQPTIRRLACVPVVAAIFLIVSHYFSIKYVNTDEFHQDRPFWYRLFYMVPMFVVFRTRLYVAWIMSECMCMTAALGAYPVVSRPRCGAGPTDFEALDKVENSDDPVEHDFETVHNLDIYGCELAPTVREGMRAWNMSVQYWLATYVYKRLPFKSNPLRVAATMTVSAFWHGIHPGYYLSFLTIPPNLVAEEMMAGAFRNVRDADDAKDDGGEKNATRAKLFDWICWFFKMRSFDYMCMGFLLLGLSETIRYWQSVYFIVHIYIVVFLVIGFVYRPRRSRNARSLASNKSE